jgi:hypothetical protein
MYILGHFFTTSIWVCIFWKTFWKALECEFLIYLNLDIWNILRLSVIYVVLIWYIFHVLVCCTKRNLATLFKSSNIRHWLCDRAKLKICNYKIV